MNKFPEKYEKPELIPLDEGLNRGWSAACILGISAGSKCTEGGAVSIPPGKNDGFIDPEILQQGL